VESIIAQSHSAEQKDDLKHINSMIGVYYYYYYFLILVLGLVFVFQGRVFLSAIGVWDNVVMLLCSRVVMGRSSFF
jgi:hypothetical protein